MKQQLKIKTPSGVKTGIYLLIAMVTVGIGILSFKTEPMAKPNAVIAKDSVGSVKAFMQVYKVLMSPRCMNCHPNGDVPLQGDDNHLHTMNIKRGIDGKGIYAVKCANCHQPQNSPGLHAPPGNPNWHLPPANMRMVFQGRTPRQLAMQIINPKQNGGKNMKQLLAHANDGLVLWGWKPGEGRTLPPLSHAEFTKQWNLWLNKGAFAPAK